MKPYLQRLYDAAGSAAAVEALPAQRSSSPLLAVDQRLASPAYAASFLLGLPGATDPDAAPPPPEPDLMTSPEPGRRDPTRALDEGPPVPVPAPRPVRPALPQPEAQDRVVVRAGPVEDPPVPPAVTAPEPPVEPTPVAHTPSPATRPVPPPVEVLTRPVVESLPRPDPAPRRTAKPPAVPRVVEPFRPAQPARLRAVPDTPARPETERPRPPSTAAPALVRPIPKPAAEPPPAPRPAEPADLADHVRRLVREAMAGDDTPRRTSRDQREHPVAEPATAAASARTAEAMSVIGPLDRPARATTLYGLRLR